MALDQQFYVGPLGDLTALPDIGTTVDTTQAVIGGTHTSLTGAFTRDVFGYKRSWTWPYPMLSADQAQWVEAVGCGMVPGPLYLLDPRRPNRLPVQTASGGSVFKTTDGLYASSANIVSYWRPLTYANTADPTTLPMRRMVAGAIQVQALSTTGTDLWLGRDATPDRIPVFAGETLTASAWVLGPSAATVAASVLESNTSGTTTVTSAGTTINPSLTAWQPVSVTFTVAATSTLANVKLTVTNLAASTSLFVTGLQVARTGDDLSVPYLQVHCDHPDLSGGWWLGGGAPRVIATPGQSSYPSYGLYSAALTLTER